VAASSTAPLVSARTAIAAILSIACLLCGWPGDPPRRARCSGSCVIQKPNFSVAGFY
jgi:hypothetical protein